MQYYEDLENFSQQSIKPTIFYQTAYGDFGGFADTIPQEYYHSMLSEVFGFLSEPSSEDTIENIEIEDHTY